MIIAAGGRFNAVAIIAEMDISTILKTMGIGNVRETHRQRRRK